MSSISISVFPEFVDKINILGLTHMFKITQDEIINIETGSRIIFKGIKTGSNIQTASLKSIANLNIVCIDEAEELPSEEIFDKIDLSARSKTRPNKVILIFNPTTKASWLYDRFFQKEGVTPGTCVVNTDTNYIHTTYQDNLKHLPTDFVKQIDKIKETNPDKFNHVILGAFLEKAEGVIYTNWKLDKFNNDLDYGYGMDFGFSIDPTSLIKVAIDKHNKIIYVDEVFNEVGKTTTEIYNLMNTGNKQVIADNAEGRLIEELKRMGINIKPCVKGAGSIGAGIKLIQDYQLVVTPSSTNIVKELNNYTWSDKKSDTPVDMYNHTLDSIRYYVSHILKAPSGVYHM